MMMMMMIEKERRGVVDWAAQILAK